MANTHDIGPFYWTTIRYVTKPKVFIEKAESQEIDGKFRKGSGIAFRVPGSTLGIVIGLWVSKADSESHALTHAIRGRVVTDELDWDIIRFGVNDD